MSEEKMTKVANQSGVYYRESASKRFHGKVDKCFYVSFKDGARKIWEKVGWVSEGYSAQMAANIRAERMRTLRHGDELPIKKKEGITFVQLWDHYNKWLDTGKTSPDSDRIRYAKHLKNRFAHKRISQITPLDLERLKSDLLKKGLSPATTKHVLVLFRQMVNKAIGWNLWQGVNPIKKVKLPQLNNKRERYLTQDEAALLLKEIKSVSQQLYEICLISLCTGMRAGEVFALKWGHCNFEEEIIHVADPKGVEPRKCFMTDAIKTILEAKEKVDHGDLIFKDNNGEQIKEISKSYKETVDRLKLNNGIDDPRQRVCFHTLRHTFASWLAIEGTPILTIKELLGHKSLAMTERYAHLSPDHKRAAASSVDVMLKEAQQKKASEVQDVKNTSKKTKTTKRKKKKALTLAK
ncbi:MAG: site-specific integrase [Chloroflexi bacterium HGW-Chloroflexi-5]|jgi:integrase|nr:MAG: site-specific integrase [Chloroflexi bacterium HGW-Chloroflexi-5]